MEDQVDLGLSGASLTLQVPALLPIGETLIAAATIENALPGIIYEAVWYLDGAPVLTETITTDEALPEFRHDFVYNRMTPENVDIKIALRYTTTLGEEQILSAVSTVTIENHSIQHWMQYEAPRVLSSVTLGYLGDFTLEWAEANDLDDFDKEVWVNARGFTSRTNYLLWVNLAYQRTNVFQRDDDGIWRLIRTCIVATGAPGRGTPPGIWTTSFKQTEGWNMWLYTVAPVVRFRDWSGYAFHSRPFVPGSTTILHDPRIGFPVSAGCVRMYNEDIWFIHDNIPDGTTVVVH
jgi:hypothetical protein